MSSLLNVRFTSTMTINGRKPYTKYEIRVSSSMMNQTWMVFKRFSEFIDLNDSLLNLIDSDQHLKKQNITLLSLPRRRLFGTMNDEVVLERQQKLELYIIKCLKYQSLCVEDLILDFLNVPEEVRMMVKTLNSSNKDRIKMNSLKHIDIVNGKKKKERNQKTISDQQVMILLHELYYQKNRSMALLNFENWYFENGSHGIAQFNPHLIKKLLIGYDKYIGLCQSVKPILYKPSSKNALSLLVKLMDIERNKYARHYIDVFLSLSPSIYKEMDLHRHIAGNENDDAFQIVSIIYVNLRHLNYKQYVCDHQAWRQFIEWNIIQCDSYIVGQYIDKQESDIFDYDIYSKNKCLNKLSIDIFEQYKQFMYDENDQYKIIQKINQKYTSYSMNVRIKKDFYNDRWKIKISFVINHDAKQIFNFLKKTYVAGHDNHDYYGWDKKLIDRKVLKKLNENDYIMHESYKSYNTPYRFRDFIVLRTFHGDDDPEYENEKYFVVYSSIINYDNDTIENNKRCIIFPSGFEISKYGMNKSYITYRFDMNEESINIINADLLGECDELFQSMLRISSMITAHQQTK